MPQHPDIMTEHLDILKEIGSICTGSATTALSQILFKKIDLEMPRIDIVSLENLPKYIGNPKQPVVGIQMKILGTINGNALIIFTKKNATTLIELLVGRSPNIKNNFTEIGISALKELGNIILSSYLSTLGTMIKKSVYPFVPAYADGTMDAVLKLTFGELTLNEPINIFLIETIFSEAINKINGSFFIAFDTASISLILESVTDKKISRL
ncbi:MAG: chemotaxis protein CheC [Candidatus Omnitrophota bacterium]